MLMIKSVKSISLPTSERKHTVTNSAYVLSSECSGQSGVGLARGETQRSFLPPLNLNLLKLESTPLAKLSCILHEREKATQ